MKGLVGAIIVILLILSGCHRGSSRALVASADHVDFGASAINETVTVAAPQTGANLSIAVVKDCAWLSVTPERVFSSGPQNSATLTLSVVRALMKPGRNACNVTLTAAGYGEATVFVIAEAIVSADFRVSQAKAGPGEPLTFSDATRVLTGASPVTSWRWEFGDGTSSTEQNPVHAYGATGVYSVSLRVESKSGIDVRVRPNCVRVQKPALPTADFLGATRRPVAGTPVQFRDLSLPGATEITGWLWNFGDGVTSTAQNPIHVFTAASVYDVYLTVSSRNGSNTAVKYGYVDVQEGK